MSFIVDALKKSEDARLRQIDAATPLGRMAPQRQRIPLWAVGLVLLLLINLVLVAFVMLRPESPANSPPVTAPLPAAVVVETRPQSNPVKAAPVSVKRERAPTREQPVAAPSRDTLIANGRTLPEATINLHVFDSDPAKRFVLLNGQRMREGDRSATGLQVERITAEGVLLSFADASFMVSIATP
jgi:hypothetical protein